MKVSSLVSNQSLVYSNLNKNVGSINEYVCKYFTNDSQIFSNNLTINDSNNDNPSRSNLSNDDAIKKEISLNLAALNDADLSKANNSIENKMKQKSSLKNKKVLFQNARINEKIFSISTLKYSIVFFLTLSLIISFSYLSVIAIVHFKSCSVENTDIPIYLIVFGSIGIIRIFLFYACPYSYAESLVFKMYEHLVWRLIVNRFKSSYNSSILVYETYKSHSKMCLICKCFLSFLISFFCCNVVCNPFCNNLFDPNSENNIFFKKYAKSAKSSDSQVNIFYFYSWS